MNPFFSTMDRRAALAMTVQGPFAVPGRNWNLAMTEPGIFAISASPSGNRPAWFLKKGLDLYHSPTKTLLNK